MTRHGPLILAPLGIEAMALRRSGLRLETAGMGPRRARRTARRLGDDPARDVAVVGLGGGLDPALAAGDVVVATEVRDARGGVLACADPSIARALRADGLTVRHGPIVSVDHIVRGKERRALAAGGALAVDMESFWLGALAPHRRFAVIRVIVDTPGRELTHPLHTLRAGWRGLRTLGRVGAALRRAFEQPKRAA